MNGLDSQLIGTAGVLVNGGRLADLGLVKQMKLSSHASTFFQMPIVCVCVCVCVCACVGMCTFHLHKSGLLVFVCLHVSLSVCLYGLFALKWLYRKLSFQRVCLSVRACP